MAGVAERALHHQVIAQAMVLRDLHQVRVAVDFLQRVGHRAHAGLVADAHGLHLVVAAAAQRGRREPHVKPEFVGELLGLFVEHQEGGRRPSPPLLDHLHHILVLQQVVVDVFDRGELLVRQRLRHEDVRMAPVEAIDVVDVLETVNPLIDAQEIEVGGADEVDRLLVPMEHHAQI